MLAIPLTQIHLSKTNPRRRRDEKADADLAENVRRLGVLQPVLVRAVEGNGAPYELVAGSRRFAAAKAAGLTEVPAIVKELTDTEALEVQVVENLQRADVHPLEEAEGYRQLAAKPGYDVATVADRVGRSAKYVYDRMKLLALTKEAKQLFLDDRITAGHAILLARLKPSDQARVIEAHEGLFQHERTLLDPEGDGRLDSMKVRSVRELQGWIDSNVRFDAKAPDPMLFPETAEEVSKAQKIVPITFSNYIPPEAKDGKTFGPRSWKRADGELKSKTCELSTTGVVMVGPHRGEAFAVCVAKEKCTVHWGAEIRERKQRAAQGPGVDAGAKAPVQPKQDDPKLVAALVAAKNLAEEQISNALGARVRELTPEKFLRATPFMRGANHFIYILREFGEKAKGDADVQKWFAKAPLPQVQLAVMLEATDGYDREITEHFGLDRDAICKEHEKRAREAYKAAQTPAQPAKPKAVAKGANKKGGSK